MPPAAMAAATSALHDDTPGPAPGGRSLPQTRSSSSPFPPRFDAPGVRGYSESESWVQSQNGAPPVRLQPQSRTFFASASEGFIGVNPVSLCEPSQKGCRDDFPHRLPEIIAGLELGSAGATLRNDRLVHFDPTPVRFERWADLRTAQDVDEATH